MESRKNFVTEDHWWKIVKMGTWLYDDTVPTTVRIIVQNWDYNFEEGWDDDPPDLNENGEAFYAVYGEQHDNGSWQSRSRTCLSLEEAIALAEKTIQGPINWEN